MTAGVVRGTVLPALASLCLAAALLVFAIYLLTWSSNQRAGLSEQEWLPGDMTAVRGEGGLTAAGFSLQADARGQAGLSLRRRDIALEDFVSLQVRLDKPYPGAEFELLWISSGTGGQTLTHAIRQPAGSVITVDLEKVRVWKGKMSALGLLVSGRGGELVTVRGISLTPASGLQTITRVLDDWTGFRGWTGSSINIHWGSRSLAHAANPPPVAALLVTLAILLLVLYRWGTGQKPVHWPAIAVIFLTCWMTLDVLWQGRLLVQLGETRRTFAGLDPEQKLLAGADASLVSFASEIERRLPDGNVRILVGSTSEYRGMRTAYYLYPNNVLWRRDGPEIPDAAQLRSGDLIALAQPTAVAYDPKAKTLMVEGGQPVDVEPVMAHAAGYLFRVQ